jgi:hypothetical protein
MVGVQAEIRPSIFPIPVKSVTAKPTRSLLIRKERAVSFSQDYINKLHSNLISTFLRFIEQSTAEQENKGSKYLHKT